MQKKCIQSGFQCEWCGDGFNRADIFKAHLGRCKQKYKVLYVSTEDRLREEVKQLKIELETSVAEVEWGETRMKDMEFDIALLRKDVAVLKAAPPVVNNIRVDKFVVQQYATENFKPLTDSAMRQCLTQPK